MKKKQYVHRVEVYDDVDDKVVRVVKDGDALLLIGLLRITKEDAWDLADFITRKFGKRPAQYKMLLKSSKPNFAKLKK